MANMSKVDGIDIAVAMVTGFTVAEVAAVLVAVFFLISFSSFPFGALQPDGALPS